jgi:superfamily II DNA/RNA helicase
VTASEDPKVHALISALSDIAAEAAHEGIGDDDTRDKRKVLVFTHLADTARYLHDALKIACHDDERLWAYRDRLVLATGSDPDSKEDAIVGFAPRTAGTDKDVDRYDLTVATDVLSEGVNLQQARHIINYDLPWNPMRLVQRHGRIDRIGSRQCATPRTWCAGTVRRSGTPRTPWCGDSTKTSTYRSSGRSARSCEARAMTWPLSG